MEEGTTETGNECGMNIFPFSEISSSSPHPIATLIPVPSVSAGVTARVDDLKNSYYFLSVIESLYFFNCFSYTNTDRYSYIGILRSI